MPALDDDVGDGRLHHERLIALMAANGIGETKGEHLARFIDVTKETGYNLLKPAYRARADTLVKLARAFGVSTDYLLGLTDRPEAYPLPEAPRLFRAD